MATAHAVIVAAGSSRRFGGAVPKQFREVCGQPLLAWTLSRFEQAVAIDQVVLVVADEQLLYVQEQVVTKYKLDKTTRIVSGGADRRQSVQAGLAALPTSTGLVAIHDGARPMILPSDINRAVDVASRERACIVASPVSDTVKRAKDCYVLATLDRDALYLAQTPQVFQYDLIMAAHRDMTHPERITDDAMLVEQRGFKVCIIEPSAPNPKVTSSEDMLYVRALLERELHG